MEMKHPSDLPWWAWTLLAVLLFSQGTLLFRDARERGSSPWFWGIWGMTTVPLPTVLYLLFVVYPDRRRRRAEQEGTDRTD
ncbi:Negative regulatory protein YxlD [compost metagenome]